MNEGLLVSVLVPTYCHEQYVKNCLLSILGQDFQGTMEVLVGDDGSTDDTLDVCRSFARSYDCVNVISRNSDFPRITLEGHRSGRSNLLDLMLRARGEFVIRVDGDDVWLSPDKLRRQVAVLRDRPEVIATYHDTVLIDEQGVVLPERKFLDLSPELSVEELIGEVSPLHISSFMYRNLPEFRQLPSLAEKVASLDLFLFPYVAARGRIVKVPGLLSGYRIHGGGVTKTGLFAGSNYHRQRIELWSMVKGHLPRRARARIEEVRDRHLKAAGHLPGKSIRPALWVRVFLRFPWYFLGRSWRLLEFLRIVRRGCARPEA